MIRPILFFILMLAITWQNSSAADNDGWGKNTHLLPQYCKDRAKGSQSPEWRKWRGTFGKAYLSIHHYCKGIFAEQKAKTGFKQRDYWLGIVKSQMKYVSGSCNTRCVIYPELHTRWGWALGEQGQTAEAIQHYMLAFKVKPDYAPAYARLSELYIEINQPDKARKTLESGLKASPDSSMLKKRLEGL